MVGAVDLFGRPLNAFGQPTPPFPGPQAMVPNRLAGFAIVTIPGMTAIGTVAQGYRNRTLEPGGGNFMQGGGGGGGGGGSRGSMGGGGAMSGDATGDDASGTGPSSVSFGLYDPQGLDANCNSSPDLTSLPLCPGDFIATVNPTAGENDGQVLSALANAFNHDFGTLGLSASYDPLTDLLSLDQPLNFPNMLLVDNSDPGLELDPVQVAIPEPASILLLAAARMASPPSARLIHALAVRPSASGPPLTVKGAVSKTGAMARKTKRLSAAWGCSRRTRSRSRVASRGPCTMRPG